MKKPAVGISERTRRRLYALLGVAVLGAGYSVQRWRQSSTPHAVGSAALPVQDAAGLVLEDVAQAAGLSNVHQPFVPHASLRNIGRLLGAIGGASVSVVDYDGDSWPDVYVTNAAKGSMNRLYHNERNGRFVDRAAAAGVADLNRESGSLRALFVDFDNDGDKDLFLTTTNCPKLLRNQGDGTFSDVTARSGGFDCGFAKASNAFDYDGDGYLDLVVAHWFKPVDLLEPLRFDFMWENESYARNGGAVYVYHNEGGKTFKRVLDALGMKSRGFTHAIGVYDLRGTGRRDLYLASDLGPDSLFFDDGGGRMRDAGALIPKGIAHSGMNAEVADLDGDGRPYLFVSDIHEAGERPHMNFLWHFDGEKVANRSREKGVDHCGFAWAGKFLDLDNDGRLDLVVGNGFLSANPANDYNYVMSAMVGGSARQITQDARRWPPMGDASIDGHQQACVFRNVGPRFVDATAGTPLQGRFTDDERGIASIDYLNDGRQNVLIATLGGPLRLYRVQEAPGHHWLGLQLTGTVGNRDALGARVQVELPDGRRLSREVEPANGLLSQSDLRVHFGLGESKYVRSVRVRWPNGHEQELKGLAVDRYHQVREEAPHGKTGG